MSIRTLFALAAFAVAPMSAQLASPNATGAAIGHVHLNVRDIDAHQRFAEADFRQVERVIVEEPGAQHLEAAQRLARIVAESPLLSRFPLRVIPNGVDLKRFRPQPRDGARSSLGLDPLSPRAAVLFAAPDLAGRPFARSAVHGRGSEWRPPCLATRFGAGDAVAARNQRRSSPRLYLCQRLTGPA